ncbi:chondroitinase-B domain-containing protein [Vibrio renipiscarius]|uniref:chondroitinase-B domain-containing protein n=1 Tax=Vibrio renipiscarius TaxID=1461322 RepID=UPI0035517FC5
MKKTLLASLIFMCAHSSYALDLDTISRDTLLSSDRLSSISSADLIDHSQQAVQALKHRLETAKDGENILITSGKYAHLGEVKITADNLTIQAEEPGKTWFTGLVQINLDGNNSRLDGLVFTEGGPNDEDGGIVINGDNNTLTNSTFYYFNDGYTYQPDTKRQEYPKRLWITVWGESATITLNRFEGKQKRGALILLQKDNTPDNHVVEKNIFLDMSKGHFGELDIKEAIRINSNSWEAVQMGFSTTSQYPSNSSFSDNLLINMDGEQELVAVKSGGNKILGNTIYQSAGLISLRHGKANNIENNIIIGGDKNLTGGIRIYDEDHVVHNNYITQTRMGEEGIAGNADVRAGIVINTGIIDVANGEKLSKETKGKELNKQWTPKNIKITNNSLIDNENGIVYGEQVHRVSMYDNKVVGSVFGGDTVRFSHNFVSAGKDTNIAIKATEVTPLTNVTNEGEVYIGQIVEPSFVQEFTTVLSDTTKINGFVSSPSVGADVSKLSVVTADIAGPSYIVTK